MNYFRTSRRFDYSTELDDVIKRLDNKSIILYAHIDDDSNDYTFIRDYLEKFNTQKLQDTNTLLNNLFNLLKKLMTMHSYESDYQDIMNIQNFYNKVIDENDRDITAIKNADAEFIKRITGCMNKVPADDKKNIYINLCCSLLIIHFFPIIILNTIFANAQANIRSLKTNISKLNTDEYYKDSIGSIINRIDGAEPEADEGKDMQRLLEGLGNLRTSIDTQAEQRAADRAPDPHPRAAAAVAPEPDQQQRVWRPRVTVGGGAQDVTIQIINDVLYGTDNTGDLIKYSTQIFYKALTILSISISLPTDFNEDTDPVKDIVNEIKKLISDKISSLSPAAAAAEANARVSADAAAAEARARGARQRWHRARAELTAPGAPPRAGDDGRQAGPGQVRFAPLAANGRPGAVRSLRDINDARVAAGLVPFADGGAPFSGGANDDPICKSLLQIGMFDVNNNNTAEIGAIIVDIFYKFYNANDKKIVDELKQAQTDHTHGKILLQKLENEKHIRKEIKNSAEQALSVIKNELAVAKGERESLQTDREALRKRIADKIDEITRRLTTAQQDLDEANSKHDTANAAYIAMISTAEINSGTLNQKEGALKSSNPKIFNINMKSNMKINIDKKIIENLKNFFNMDSHITPQKPKGGQKTQKNRGGSRKNMNSIDSDDSVDPNDSHL